MCDICQRWCAALNLTTNVSFPLVRGCFTITSITPSVGCVSLADHYICHPNMMDFDEIPPTRLGTGAVKGHTTWTSIWIIFCLLLASKKLKKFRFMLINFTTTMWLAHTDHLSPLILLLFLQLVPSLPHIERGFGPCWGESSQLRPDVGVNMRILSLTGCQYKAIYGIPWRIDPLDNRQFLCSAGHRDLKKTKPEQREVSRDKEEGETGRQNWEDVIRSIYYRESAHAYSDAPSSSALILKHEPGVQCTHTVYAERTQTTQKLWL